MKTKAKNEAHTAKISLYLIGDNLIKAVTHEGSHIELDDIKEIQRVRREMIGMKPYCAISMSEKYVTIDADARKFASSKENVDNRLALAVVVDNLAHRIIGNFFVNAHNPHTPAKLFSSEKEAMKWLEQFLK